MEGEKGRGRRKVGEENTLERGKKLGEKNKNKFWAPRLPSTYRCVGFENAAKGRSNVRGISTAIGSRFHTVVVFSLISEQQHGTRLLRVIWLFSFFFLWTWPPHVFSTLYYTGWDRCKSSLKALSSQAEPSPRRSSSSSNTTHSPAWIKKPQCLNLFRR